MKNSIIKQELIRVGISLEIGEIEYSGAESKVDELLNEYKKNLCK